MYGEINVTDILDQWKDSITEKQKCNADVLSEFIDVRNGFSLCDVLPMNDVLEMIEEIATK